MIDPTLLPLRLPAALATFWGTGREAAIAKFRESVGEKPGVHWLSTHQGIVLPEAGDPAVFDAALALASGVLFSSQASVGERSTLQTLICPCHVRLADGEIELLGDSLVDDIRERPPRCADGVITMTSISTTQLDHARRFHEAGIYEGPSGRLIPLVQVGAEDPTAPPWRNPTVLRSSRPYISRPRVEAELRECLASAGKALRIRGAFGCGKTRLVWQLLRELHGAPPLWATARPARHGGPTLAAQIIAQLVRSNPEVAIAAGLGQHEFASLLVPHRQPVRLLDPQMASELLARVLRESDHQGSAMLVCDGLEAAAPSELETLNHLADVAADSGAFRLILIARPATAWPESWWILPEVAIPPMGRAELEEFARGTFAGLSLPEQVEERFLTAAAGNPFALEEGLAGLIPLKQVRQVYGSFFFSGADDADFAPSARLTFHVEAEARRLGGIGLLRRLAVADTAIPHERLVPSPSEDARSSDPAHEEWHRAMTDHGWLREAESPWGPGVELCFPAHAMALAATLADEDRDLLRRELGLRLWEHESSARPAGEHRGAWWIFQLLGDSAAAVEPLLVAAQHAETSIPPEELFEALKAELGREREREGGADTRLDLLWYMLPLARKLGVLQEHGDDVDEALASSRDDPKRLLAFASLKAELEERKGHMAEAIATIRTALRDARDDTDTSHRTSEAVLALQLARLLIRREHLEEARLLLEELAPPLEGRGSRSLVAACTFYLGNIAVHQERFNDALALHRGSLAVRRKLSSPKPAGASLSALGALATQMGRYIEALEAYREAEEIFSQLGDEEEASFALLGIGRALSRLGDYASASRPLRKALSLREQARGDAVGQAIARLEVAENYFHLELAVEALREARHALFDLTLLTDSSPRADAEQLLGRILLSQRQATQACEHFEAALEGHRKARATQEAALDLAYWLDATLAAEDLEETASVVQQLGDAVGQCAHAERREILEYRLHKGLLWLAEHRLAERRLALPHLERAYAGLMEKTRHLPPKERHRFLFQIPEHEAIISAATARGLSLPGATAGAGVTTKPLTPVKD